VDEERRAFEITLSLPRGRPRTVVLTQGPRSTVTVETTGPEPSRTATGEIAAAVSHILRLDQDLAPFYAGISGDPELAWVAEGAGRMIRSQTVFEDVVKTICTTNCTWAATERMVGALVEHLGEPADGPAPAGPRGRAFPTPAAMAESGDGFYTDVARAGYRGAYLRRLADDVAAGSVDLEVLADPALPDDDVEHRLLALPGVGPYAAAHVMMMGLGRTSRLILDSWTRPTYARLTGGRAKSDGAIARRFRRYRPYEGLAFWLFLTRGWVDANPALQPSG
jgi:N-glycosylase/DNA lyase